MTNTTLVNSPLIAMGMIEREATMILASTLNDELSAQEEFWTPYDEEFATYMDIDFEPVVLEKVLKTGFHKGFQPSLIKAPLEEYPNVSVWTDRAGQAAFDNIDQMDAYRLRLVIELLVKAEDDATVNDRALRTAEAVNICLMSNATLNGKVSGFDGPPTVQKGEVFYRKEDPSYGTEVPCQGVRMEYAVTKEATKPMGSVARPATSAPSFLTGADYDQA
jgi:hypothetical protein